MVGRNNGSAGVHHWLNDRKSPLYVILFSLCHRYLPCE